MDLFYEDFNECCSNPLQAARLQPMYMYMYVYVSRHAAYTYGEIEQKGIGCYLSFQSRRVHQERDYSKDEFVVKQNPS